VPTTQPAQIQGTLTVVGVSTKKLKKRQEFELESSNEAFDHFQAGMLNELAKRQAGCVFYVSVDNVTVYSVDLDTVPMGTPLPFNSSAFTPNDNSTIAYVEQCPPGTTNFPVLNVANLVLITGPAAPAAVSSASSSPTGSVVTVTTTNTIALGGSTVTQISTLVQTLTATATTTDIAVLTATQIVPTTVVSLTPFTTTVGG
jgi:hypothetical protein